MSKQLLGRRWRFGVVALMVLAGVASSQAGFTPSGTLIEAQASATFVDADAQQRETLSNVVVTVVQQVGKVLLSGEPRRSGVAGSSLDLPFALTNAGNDRDTISLALSVTGTLAPDLAAVLYADENCNGRTDAGEPSISQRILEAGARACLVVRVGVAADTAAIAGATAGIGLAATSSIASTVEPGDDVAGATGTVTLADAPVLTGFVQATPSSSVAQGGTIDYVVSMSNTGASSACALPVTDPNLTDPVDAIWITVTLPAGLQLVGPVELTSGAGDVSGSLGTPIWSVATGDPATLRAYIAGNGCFYPQGAASELTFSASVASPTDPAAPWTGPAQGATYTVAVGASYATTSGGDAVTAPFNDVTHSVLPARAVAFDGGDATLASATSGSTIELVRAVRNLGNTSDAFDVTLTPPSGSDWTCRLYRADGVTPLHGALGPLAPNAAQDVVTRCQIPAGDTADGRVVGLAARSASDHGVTAAMTWTITQVDGGLAVAVAVQGVPSAALAAGAELAFLTRVGNTGANADNYTLTANLAVSAGTPVSWSAAVRYHPAAIDAQGDCSAATPRPAAVSTSGILMANEARCFEVVTSVPGTASSDWTGAVTVSATSSHDPSVDASAATGAITVALSPGLSFGPDRSGTVTSPGAITVEHIVRNTGNAVGTLRLTGSSLSPSGSGNALYAWDAAGTFTIASDLAPRTLAAGEEATLYVRLLAASGQAPGRRITLTVTAELDFGGGAVVQRSVNNTYDVVDGRLRLQLDVCTSDVTTACSGSGDAARPGQYLHYTLVATNLGSAPLADVIVTEPMPGFTDFVSVGATRSSGFTAGTIEFDGGGGWSATAPASVASGDAVHVRVRDASGQLVPIPPGASVTITLIVRVR